MSQRMINRMLLMANKIAINEEEETILRVRCIEMILSALGALPKGSSSSPRIPGRIPKVSPYAYDKSASHQLMELARKTVLKKETHDVESIAADPGSDTGQIGV